MRHLVVRRSTSATANAMFTLLADPATYLRCPGVKRAELLRPGRDSLHGAGAVRRIWIGSFRFDEEITQSVPGVRLDYRVIASRPRLEHEGGTILFLPAERGCIVEWSTVYRVPVPVLGPVLAVVGGWRMRRAFDDAIRVSAELAAQRYGTDVLRSEGSISSRSEMPWRSQ